MVGLAVLLLGWLLGFPPGFSTFANMYAIGVFIDWIIPSGLIPIQDALPRQLGLLLLSIAFTGADPISSNGRSFVSNPVHPLHMG